MSSPAQFQVGFQADIIAGGSLIHQAAGRLLKAMSDGGIDPYAVGAAVDLGKIIPIKDEHENEVNRLLAMRGGRTGFLCKALHIGWGHSDIAVELARTKAGTSALLTIGAFATGTTSYIAARGLQELMKLYGRQPDMLPNIDALTKMVSYLSPFMVSSGFRVVFEHIATTTRQKLHKLYLNESAGQHISSNLLTAGEYLAWTPAVKQLILTASRNEYIFLLAKQRVVWLAAYAAHILGMEVELRWREHVLWGAAGSRGAVVFQLENLPGGLSTQLDKPRRVEILQAPSTEEGRRAMHLDQPLAGALKKEMEFDDRISPTISQAIQEAIVRVIATLKVELAFFVPGTTVDVQLKNGHRINGFFESDFALVAAQCKHLGIAEDIIQIGWANRPQRLSKNVVSPLVWDFDFLSDDQVGKIRSVCEVHGSLAFRAGLGTPDACLCARIARLVQGFGLAAIALSQFAYDLNELHVRADILNGQTLTQFSHRISTRMELDSSRPGKTSRIYVGYDTLLLYLSQLLHGREALDSAQSQSRLLAISKADNVIYFWALVDADCFDH